MKIDILTNYWSEEIKEEIFVRQLTKDELKNEGRDERPHNSCRFLGFLLSKSPRHSDIGNVFATTFITTTDG